MKISTKGRYALRLLVDLAEHRDQGYIPLKDIAQRQGISKKYLEQIVGILSRGGLLHTSRGYQGGYMLADSPERCSVGQVLRITEGDLIPVSCLAMTSNSCQRSFYCNTLPIWQGLERVIAQYLDGISLQDILDSNTDLHPDSLP